LKTFAFTYSVTAASVNSLDNARLFPIGSFTWRGGTRIVSESGGQVLLREGTTTTIKGEKVEVSIVNELKIKKPACRCAL
jgi:hypothetical protein